MRLLLTIYMVCAAGVYGFAQPMQMISNGSSSWKIVAMPGPGHMAAAKVLQDYFKRATGVQLPISSLPAQAESKSIIIGSDREPDLKQLKNDGYIIRTHGNHILISGLRGKSVLYGVYAFIEKYMGGRKWDGGRAFIPYTASLTLPSGIDEKHEPVLAYRETYFPPSFDQEYLDWHGLHRFEESWGLWGHSFFKLVPPKKYFTSHPEYFSLINGKREAVQLCLSNKAVLAIVINDLRQRIKENADAKYWSVSRTTISAPCECTQCKKLDETDGNAQGSLLYFVNAIAKEFPDKMITTLAYGYTAAAPARTKPAPNVVVMLSTIDAFRSLPLQTESSAASFRNNLQQWKSKAGYLFVWDYSTTFTNYLAPFPVEPNLANDIRYLSNNHVTGIFQQGSGDTHADMAELKSYLFAKLSFDASRDAGSIESEFLSGYYGNAAPFVQTMLHEMRSQVKQDLDIYGNPVNSHNDYLSPMLMDRYSSLMDKAEAAVAHDPARTQRVLRIRLSQEYTFLQQARFYGKSMHGIYVRDEHGNYAIRMGLSKRIENFVTACRQANVKELSEGGITPEAYLAEWKSILSKPVPVNKAAHAKLSLQYPFAPEYPSKKEETLVDETPGYADFSYNWLCFYNQPMIATIDMGKASSIGAVTLHFLEDPRHWIFHPRSIELEVSDDGIRFRKIKSLTTGLPEEDYAVTTACYRFDVSAQARFIRVRADNQAALPAWRYHRTKKPMIACDEIWVE